MYTEQELQEQSKRVKNERSKYAKEREENTLYRMRQINFDEQVADAQKRPPAIVESYDALRALHAGLTQPQNVIFIRPSDGGVTDIVLVPLKPGKRGLRNCPKNLW